MADYSTRVKIEGQEAASVLDSLEMKAQRLEQTLQRIASSLGTKAFGSPEFQAGLQELAATQGAMGAVRQSAGLRGRDLEQAVAGGAKLGAGALRDVPAGIGGSAMMQIVGQVAEQAGAGYQRPFNANTFTQGVIEQARAMSAPTMRMPAAGGSVETTAMPAVMSSATTTPTDALNQTGVFTRTQLGLPDPNRTQAFDVQRYNAWQRQNYAQATPPGGFWETRRGQMAIASLGFGVAQAADIRTQEIVSGQTNYIGRGQAIGGGIGAGIGAAFGNPILAMGLQFGLSALGGMIAAPMEKGVNIATALMGTEGLVGNPYGQSLHMRSEIVQRIARGINERSAVERRADVTAESIAAGAGAMGRALIQGGIDPTQFGGNLPVNVAPPFMAGGIPRGIPLIDTLAALGASGISSLGGMTRNPNFARDVDLGIQSTRNPAMRQWLQDYKRAGLDARRYGQDLRTAGQPIDLMTAISQQIHTLYPTDEAARQVINTVAPVWSTLPETNNNLADQLMRFGPTATYQFLQSVPGSTVTPNVLGNLMRSSSAIRSAGRDVQMAATMTRGGGLAAMAGLDRQMEAIAGVQGGADSLLYAQTRQARRDAGRAAFDEASIESFSIPMAQLDTMRAISQALPYSPNRGFDATIASIRMSSRRIGELRQYMGARRRAGELSVEEEYERTREIGALEVSRYQGIAELSEGMDDRLFALQAGRPAGAGRIDSIGLAALRLGSFPRRGYGAANGRQLKSQNDFIRSLGFDEGDMGPWGSGVGGASFGGSSRMEQLLAQILSAIERNNTGPLSSQRPGEVRGKVGGDLDARQGRLGGGRDSGYN